MTSTARMSAKRSRHTLSDGRASPEEGKSKVQIQPELAVQIMRELEQHLQSLPPADSEQSLGCPFAAKDPQRYAGLKGEWGRACRNRSWSNIADFKDHLKRSHSSNYGCIYCGKRFHCRDNNLEQKRKTHEKEECKWHPPFALFQPGDQDPDLMDLEQEDRVLKQINFKTKEYKHLKLDLENQAWALVEGIWPGTPKRSFSIWAAPGRRMELSLKEIGDVLFSLVLEPVEQNHQDPNAPVKTGPYNMMFGVPQPSETVVSKSAQIFLTTLGLTWAAQTRITWKI